MYDNLINQVESLKDSAEFIEFYNKLDTKERLHVKDFLNAANVAFTDAWGTQYETEKLRAAHSKVRTLRGLAD